MDASFINHLPPELLAIIASFTTDQNAIFLLATVCRYWHNALTGTAVLWTSIDCRSESRTLILLRRSKSKPIDVTIDRARFTLKAVSLVADNAYRIRSMDVNLPPHHLRQVHDFFYCSAPILRIMRLRGREGDFAWSPPPHGPFSQDQLPALKALYLEGYPFDLARSTTMMTNGLTTLVLDNNRHGHHLHHLLEHLEHSKRLEHLSINLPNLNVYGPAPRVVSLPKLREVRMIHSPLALLQHLLLPPSTYLDIRTPSRKNVGENLLPDAWAQDTLLVVFQSRAIESIRMVFSESKCAVLLLGSHLSVLMQAESTLSFRNSFYSYCLDSFQSLPIANTKVLWFAQPPWLPFPGKFLSHSCTRLLLQMRSLQRIILDGSVAQWLVRALEPADGDVPCPNLGDLTVVRRAGHETNLRDGLLALSKQREDRGCPLTSCIGSPGSSDWQEITQLERVI